ncbi:MAG: aminoacyl-tRNA hydrolase [Clostridia bacterium]|nr:aminoacyl-tRNA hydrolase [Clostridia bacterium]
MADIYDLFRKIEKTDATPAGPVTHLIVGLGNPGAEYAFTRHNAGFLALDKICAGLGVKTDRARFRALTGEGTVAGQRVLFLKPQTYMNLSGEAVREAAAFYKIEPGHILVISDDINLDVGRLRVREKGSDGGHNGLKNIIYQLGSDAFPRIRIGVGRKPNPEMDLADFVLSRFTEAEMERLSAVFDTVLRGVELLLAGDAARAKQECNGSGQ